MDNSVFITSVRDKDGTWTVMDGRVDSISTSSSWDASPYYNLSVTENKVETYQTSKISEEVLAYLCSREYAAEHGFEKMYNALKEKKRESMKIRKIIFNNPATIVLWNDGTKTVVKACDEDWYNYDPTMGLLLCILKKIYPAKSNNEWKREIKPILEQIEEEKWGM